jgi:hypothetical protein
VLAMRTEPQSELHVSFLSLVMTFIQQIHKSSLTALYRHSVDIRNSVPSKAFKLSQTTREKHIVGTLLLLSGATGSFKTNNKFSLIKTY